MAERACVAGSTEQTNTIEGLLKGLGTGAGALRLDGLGPPQGPRPRPAADEGPRPRPIVGHKTKCSSTR